MKLTEWVKMGYLDHKEKSPGKRIPNNRIEEFYLIEEQAPKEANAYWDGFNSGVFDTINNII